MLKKSLITWERTLRNSISPFSKDADLVRQMLVKKVKEIKQELKRKMSKGVVETTRYKLTLEVIFKIHENIELIFNENFNRKWRRHIRSRTKNY